MPKNRRNEPKKKKIKKKEGERSLHSGPIPPYFQPKSKCVLNDSEWLERNLDQS